jgi:putative oxidoreductase
VAKSSKSRDGGASRDMASLMLRLTIGPMMMTHGINKVRGPGGIEGTTRWFAGLGFKPAAVHARMAAATEIGTGALLTVGAMTPMAAAGVVGVMTSAAATDHKGKGFFIFKGGWEYVAVVAGVATTIAALGPGRISIDGLRGKPHGSFVRALLAAALGVAAAQGVLATRQEPETPAS